MPAAGNYVLRGERCGSAAYPTGSFRRSGAGRRRLLPGGGVDRVDHMHYLEEGPINPLGGGGGTRERG